MPVRRIFLVLAMLALLVLTAMPATDNSKRDHGKNWWDDDNDWEDHDKDWWDDDNDWEDHDANIWCSWFPSFWGWDLWCYSPWFGWWEAS
jgi:hypothetical protein